MDKNENVQFFTQLKMDYQELKRDMENLKEDIEHIESGEIRRLADRIYKLECLKTNSSVHGISYLSEKVRLLESKFEKSQFEIENLNVELQKIRINKTDQSKIKVRFNKDEEKEFIDYYESMNPQDFLKTLLRTESLEKSEHDFLARLILDYNLPVPVVNVLMDLSHTLQEEIVNFNFIEKSANNWERKRIEKENYRNKPNH